MTLFKGYCRIEKEDDCFSVSLKFILAQFKFIPDEFKYRRDSNGLKLHFHTLTKTDARIHAKSMFSKYRELRQLRIGEALGKINYLLQSGYKVVGTYIISD
jgi:hypothetical protein